MRTEDMLQELRERLGNPKDGELIWDFIIGVIKRAYEEMSEGVVLSQEQKKSFSTIIDMVEDEKFHCHIHK